MPLWFPPEGSENDPTWWRALERVAELTRRTEALPTIAACEFMFMAVVDCRRRGRIWQYKHIWTRRYLHLDDAGRAYIYIPPRDIERSDGRYVPHRSLRDALDHLELEMAPDSWRAERRRGCEQCDPTMHQTTTLTEPQ